MGSRLPSKWRVGEARVWTVPSIDPPFIPQIPMKSETREKERQ
jgi:hypothetical protein